MKFKQMQEAFKVPPSNIILKRFGEDFLDEIEQLIDFYDSKQFHRVETVSKQFPKKLYANGIIIAKAFCETNKIKYTESSDTLESSIIFKFKGYQVKVFNTFIEIKKTKEFMNRYSNIKLNNIL